MNNTSFKVEVHLYDLSQGLAKQFSPIFLGKQIDGIWHTGLVCYGKEYYFGGGICAGDPKQTPYGYPVQIIDNGVTERSQEDFEIFLLTISDKYSMQSYDLFKNNCNNFTNECSEFLLSKGIPVFITGLPQEVLNTQIGQMIKPMIEKMTNKAMSDNSQQHFSAPQEQYNDQYNQMSGLMSNMNGGFNLNGGVQPQQQPQGPQQPTNVMPIGDLEMFLLCTETSQRCVIVFYADWCGSCKIIKPTFDELSNSNLDINFYEVNYEEAKEIAQQLGVNSFPTFVTYKSGQMIEKWTGGDVATLREKVRSLKN